MHKIRKDIYHIIFRTDTFWAKTFDIFILILILLSLIILSLQSVESINKEYGQILNSSEWLITILFTIEYLLRIYSSPRPMRYIFSFWGIIDLMAILPTYLTLFIAGTHFLSAIRGLRLIRIFKVLNLSSFEKESRILAQSLKASIKKIEIFLFVVFIIVVIIGTLMYYIEGPENGFTSIPKSIYWAIVTITTVGYGDISPQTGLGQFLSSLIMIIGYGIIAVPTGIVSAEMVKSTSKEQRTCPSCKAIITDADAKFCKYCGSPLKQE